MLDHAPSTAAPSSKRLARPSGPASKFLKAKVIENRGTPKRSTSQGTKTFGEQQKKALQESFEA